MPKHTNSAVSQVCRGVALVETQSEVPAGGTVMTETEDSNLMIVFH